MDQLTVKHLTDARDYLADPAHFITFTRWSDDNIKNCALGAIERAYGFHTWPQEEGRMELQFHLLPEVNYLNLAINDLDLLPHFDDLDSTYRITEVNNELGHEPTLAMFNRAIELATADPS